MTAEAEDDLDRVERIFLGAKDLTWQDQAAFVEQACAGDSGLREEVERYLAAHRLEETSAPDAFAKRIHEQFSQVLGAAPRPDPFVGKRLGSYLITQKIAEGGMGAVYEARQDKPARRVALKLIPPSRLHDDVARERFQFEVEALARLDHVAIARVYEAGTHDVPGVGVVPFFAMEFVAGAEPVSSYCEKRSLPARERLRLLVSVCDAVHHAHQRGILHRDLKPSNILVDDQGRPKVIDFGIARALGSGAMSLTRSNLTPGTPMFMSPEQWEAGSHAANVPSDVYALGIVGLLTLTGRLPFDFPEGASENTKLAIVRTADPCRLRSIDRSWHRDVDAILGMAVDRDPDRRYQTAGELGVDIERHLRREPPHARPPTFIGGAARFVLRKPWQSLSAGAVAVILAVTLVAVQIEKKRRIIDRDRYRFAMMTAEIASREGDYSRAAQILEEANKTRGRELRGWEHAHLDNRSRTSLGRVTFAERVAEIAITPDGRDVVVRTDARTDATRLVPPLIWFMKLEDFLDGERIAPKPTDISKGVTEGPSGAVRMALCDAGRLLCCSIGLEKGAGALVVFDMATRTRRGAALDIPEASALAGHPNLPVVAVGTNDGMVRLLSANGDQLGEAPPSKNTPAPGIRCAAWDPFGRRLAVGTEGRETRILDMSDLGRPVVTTSLMGHFLHVVSLDWSPDGCLLATGSSDRTVRIWDVEASERTRSPVEVAALVGHTGGLFSARFVPHYGFGDGRYALVTGAADQTVRFWDLQTRRRYVFMPAVTGATCPEGWPSRGHEEAVRCIAVTPDGRTALSGSDDRTVRAWSACALESVFELRGHLTSVASITWSGDASQIASGDAVSKFFIWDRATGIGFSTSLPTTRRAEWWDGSLAWHPKAPVIAVGTAEGGVFIFDVRDPAQPRLVKTLRERDPLFVARGTSLQFSGDGQMLACATHDFAQWWKLDPGDPTNVIAAGALDSLPGTCLTRAALSRDGARIALGGRGADGRAIVLLFDRGAQSASRVRRGAQGSIDDLAFSPDGRLLAVTGDLGADARIVRLWDFVSDRDLELNGHAGRAYAVAWHPSKEAGRIATSSHDRTIRIWDTENQVEMTVLRGNVSVPRGLAFSPDGKTLASAMAGVYGTENVVKLWETDADPRRRVVRAHLRECADLFDQTVVEKGQASRTDRIGTMSEGELEKALAHPARRFDSETLATIRQVWAARRGDPSWAAASRPRTGR
jgi:WD40 repeat protein/tRNA A-37 threonylcarbamoyl transferase component Bud32